MKALLTGTALALALTATAHAQETAVQGTATTTAATEAPMHSPYVAGVEEGVRASDFIGKRVYVTEADTAALRDGAFAEVDANWEDAGEISDLMISLSGDTEVVLIDFGGFLGIGEKTVAINMADLVMVPDSDSPSDYFIVFNGTKADLEGAPAFDPDMVFTATEVEAPAVEPVNADTSAVVSTTEPAVGTGVPVDFASMTEDDLIGKRVYGPNNEDVGEVSAVATDGNGAITAAVIDVGGFLGIGEKEVALTGDMLWIEAEGDDSVLRVDASQAELEAMPPHRG